MPGAINVTIKGAGHFLQEDVAAELAAMNNDFIAGEYVTVLKSGWLRCLENLDSCASALLAVSRHSE